MATRFLRRCLNSRDQVTVYYDDATQKIYNSSDPERQFYIKEKTCGQLHYSDVPYWLGRDAMMKSPVLAGTDIYLQKVGSLLYRVKTLDGEPYGEVKNEAWTTMSATFTKKDCSAYGVSDGSYQVTISGGSGYFGQKKYLTPFEPTNEPVLLMENLSPNTYYVHLIDRLTSESVSLTIEITQPAPAATEPTACNVVIEGIEIQKTSTRTATDGQVKVYASGANAMEYRMNTGGVWQDSPLFTGVASNFHGIYVRDKANLDCIKSQNIYVGYHEEIILSDVRVSNVTCFGKANGSYRFSIGPSRISGYYTYLWSDGSTKPGRYDLAAGQYQLTITSRNGDTKTVDVTIGINSNAGPWDVEITIDRNNVYVDPKGQVLWYLWNDGHTKGSRENLARGQYILKLGGGDGWDKSCFQSYVIVIEGDRHFFSDNPIPLKVRANNIATKKDLSFVSAVYLENEYGSGEFQQVGPVRMEQPADKNGEALFFLQSILQSHLKSELPDMQQVGIKLMTDQMKRFYLAHFEKYGNPATMYDNTIQQIQYVLAGGLNKVEVSADDFFDVYLPQVRPFYSWQPSEKEVFLDQPEFLYYCCGEHNLAQAQVWIRLYFDDFTQTEDNLFSVNSPKQYELYRFPSGFEQLRLTDYELDKKITHYDIWVSDGLFIPLSETRTFYVNREKPERAKYFFYLNSLGCYETLATTGYSEHSMKVGYETFEPTEQRVLGLQEIGSRMLNKTAQEEVSVPVGFPAPTMRLALKDFALSTKVFLMQSGRMIPVEIELNGVYLDELEPLGDLTIRYKLPKDHKFTPDMAAKKVVAAEPLVVNLVEKKDVINGEAGSITIEVIGGIPPYSFLWNNGETTQNVSGLPEGTYSVAVQDSSAVQRFGRLNNIKLVARTDETLSYIGAGSFEEFTTTSINTNYWFDNGGGDVQISTNIKRTGSKSLRLATVVGSDYLPEGFLEPKAEYKVNPNHNYRASVWVYIPAGVGIRNTQRTEVDYTKLKFWTGLSLNGIANLEYTATVNPASRGTWQYLETIIRPSQIWKDSTLLERNLFLQIGFEGVRSDGSKIWEPRIFLQDTVMYFDDFSLVKLA